MINIKMHENKWRMTINEETWEFNKLEELKTELDKILAIKESHGRIVK